MRPDAIAGRPGWRLIENDGALFRGPSRGSPREVWNPGAGWTAYADSDRPRDVAWGYDIDSAEASRLMDALEARRGV